MTWEVVVARYREDAMLHTLAALVCASRIHLKSTVYMGLDATPVEGCLLRAGLRAICDEYPKYWQGKGAVNSKLPRIADRHLGLELTLSRSSNGVVSIFQISEQRAVGGLRVHFLAVKLTRPDRNRLFGYSNKCLDLVSPGTIGSACNRVHCCVSCLSFPMSAQAVFAASAEHDAWTT